MRHLVLATLVAAGPTVGYVFTASSADLGRPAPAPVYTKAPVTVPFSWTGLYVGINTGGGWSSNDWFVPNTPINIAGGCAVPGCNFSVGGHTGSGWLAGGQIGYNYQVNWAVLGIEAEADWANLTGSNAQTPAPSSFITDHSKIDAIGTIAARMGAAWDRSLLYVKGGGAWAHDDFFTSTASTNVILAATLNPAQTVTATRWGWVVGAGWEYAFWSNWSAKVEYEHLDFGTSRETLQPATSLVQPFQYDIRETVDEVKAGINYRFRVP